MQYEEDDCGEGLKKFELLFNLCPGSSTITATGVQRL